ncbi:MAG: porphobilinogen synthase [Chlamydiales bacterium]
MMLLTRPRRNRKSSAIRGLVRETRLHKTDLIYPLFVREGINIREAIPNMPNTYRFSVDSLLHEIERAMNLGLTSVALFPLVAKKEEKEAYNPDALMQRAIRATKERFPELCVIADVALDPYTLHGHDGVIDEAGEVLNDPTVAILQKMALAQARAGVDMVAPSDMMDGRVRAIREALDREGFEHVNIHAYSAKYASAFYGPFRDAVASGLKNGDKKTYQMDPANKREAVREVLLDEGEGADIVMIKPAVHYLDVIAAVAQETTLPVSAYHVSGEYAMLMGAIASGFVDKEKGLWECMISIKRAGADMIFTYAAPEVAQLITNGAP